MKAVALVHEAPSQRRSYRVSVPATVVLAGVRYGTRDWGLGGFRIEPFAGSVQAGERIHIEFRIDFQNFDIAFPASAEVVRTSKDSMAAKFIDLGERETELLRYFISCTTRGEIAAVDRTLTHIDRPVTPVRTSSHADSRRTETKRKARRVTIAVLYVAAGLLLSALILKSLAGAIFLLRIDTAVVSTALDQIVSQDVGKLVEVFVQTGAPVRTDEPLVRVESDMVMRDVQTAREELDGARIALQAIQDRRRQASERLEAYQTISRDQLELVNARLGALVADRDLLRTQFERSKSLFDAGLMAAQLFEEHKAKLERQEALLGQAVAEQKIAETSIDTTKRGSFFSGNFLVGDLPALTAEESAARDRVAAAKRALDERLSRVAERTYRAPYDGVVTRVFKSAGVTVDRGEPILILQRSGAEPYIEAYLTQDEAANLTVGARGTARVSPMNREYDVRVVSVDRTAGFLKEVQTPHLSEPQYTWRGLSDRSAYAKLEFVGLVPTEMARISPGLPVHVDLRKPRTTHVPPLLGRIYAASPEREPTMLWPANSPLFSGTALKISDPRFSEVRQAVIEAADHALRVPPAPVKVLVSAGGTNKSDLTFQKSRRAFEDSDHCALLALAWTLTGRSDYRAAAQTILQAWARVHQPTGQPVDETRLDGLLWGLDLLGGTQESAVVAWLKRWNYAARAWRFGPKTERNNHKTHHLKILLMLDKLLGRDRDYERDLREAEQHLRVNLPNADGSSLDYHERDALHYHVFDLEAWEEIALVTGCCGAGIDRAFNFFRVTALQTPEHVEFSGSTAPIDRKRAAAGFEYAQAHAYQIQEAARAIFGYATVSGRKPEAELQRAAEQGRRSNNLFYEARYYLWQPQ
jgi:multidrug resistance efflux pump